jgi:hypothetical protein
MNSTREYTMFAPAQLLRNWRVQRPSNKGDLDSSVTTEIRRVYKYICHRGYQNRAICITRLKNLNLNNFTMQGHLEQQIAYILSIDQYILGFHYETLIISHCL